MTEHLCLIAKPTHPFKTNAQIFGVFLTANPSNIAHHKLAGINAGATRNACRLSRSF